ncbi:helix-turn-helix domain-containing protein [Sinomonas sp. P47F7]|uniref:helix-turn-helix domain-containing protein n=1 Tax=Sinomonas sp. P47F7 TaxID=3410987 RepID=UPI003BF618BF
MTIVAFPPPHAAGHAPGDDQELALSGPVNPLRLFTVAEAAEILGTGDDYVRGRIAAGEIAVVELGTKTRAKTRVNAVELHRFIQGRTHTAN